MNNKVLIVDDDPAICKLLQKVMDNNSLVSSIANSGEEAIIALKESFFDIILLDVTLGDMDGFDVIKEIRAMGMDTPVIIISGNDDDFDVLYGLNIGADDYITKPFNPITIGAKVKAVIRRDKTSQTKNDRIIVVSRFKFDTDTLKFFKDNNEILLSNKEAKMMQLFLKNPNKVFTKEMIYEQIWGDTIVVDDNTIMVYISRLREKIEENAKSPKHIKTVRGVGYRFTL